MTTAPHPTGCSCTSCGASINRLLDVGMTWPDDVYAIPGDQRASRVWQDGAARADFMTLDEARYFVRSLVPLPLWDGALFRYGVWLEVSRSDFDHIRRVWNDEPAYARLQFRATLANELEPGDRLRGTSVQAATRSFNDRPYVVNAEAPSLAATLKAGWDQQTYEQIVQPYS